MNKNPRQKFLDDITQDLTETLNNKTENDFIKVKVTKREYADDKKDMIVTTESDVYFLDNKDKYKKRRTNKTEY